MLLTLEDLTGILAAKATQSNTNLLNNLVPTFELWSILKVGSMEDH